jgi:hypothetical protein
MEVIIIQIKIGACNMCYLCESNDITNDGILIIKRDGKYILEFYEKISKNIKDIYLKFGELEITHCPNPECNRKLGD